MQCTTILPYFDTNLLFQIDLAFSRLGIGRNRPFFHKDIGNCLKFDENLLHSQIVRYIRILYMGPCSWRLPEGGEGEAEEIL